MRLRLRWPVTLSERERKEQRETPTGESITTPKIEFYPEFYSDRAAMDGKGRTLAAELRDKDVNHFWVSFESGKYFSSLNKQDIPKIRRLTLLNADCQWAKDVVAMISKNDISGEFDLAIRNAIRFAVKYKIQVRLSDKPMMNVVIADPEDPESNSWARINIFLPYTTSEEWPVIVIYKTKEPRLFAVIKDAYDEMWNNAKEPIKP